MPQNLDWRSHSAYDYVDQLTPSQLAWEFLRRNPKYRIAFEQFVSSGRVSDEDAAAFAKRWGLRFPRRAASQRDRAADLLDPRNRRWCDSSSARIRVPRRLPPHG
ncbi:transcriptional regulator domain-containing protein [Brucella intermedia]|uniref:transcriptional regulator domain-containing protein n=1 Tax=Hyphomicrobiales TaxID=356 RepID=UPI003C7A5AD6